MGDADFNSVWKILNRVLDDKGTCSLVEDAQLLGRFIASRDEVAFETLVQRHAAPVWSVCRSILRNVHDSEDAFQATFLTLARRASSISNRKMLGGWLRQVARRVALKAQAQKADRIARERKKAITEVIEDPTPACVWQEVRSVLDEEVERLPLKYRLPFVLCHLEGKTNAEAARRLECPLGTVESRLVEARSRLAKRLSRRGITLASGLEAVAAFNQSDAAIVPVDLIPATARAGLVYATKGALDGVVSTEVDALARGMVHGMRMMSIVKAAVLLALVVGLPGLGTGLLIWREVTRPHATSKPDGEPKSTVKSTDVGSTKRKPVKVDLFGDALPQGALARLGTVGFRHGEGIRSLTYALNDKVLIAGGWYGGIRIWDAATGKELRRLEGGGSVVFADDNKTLASAWKDKVRLWDPASGKLLWQKEVPFNEDVLSETKPSLAYTSNGKILAVGISGDIQMNKDLSMWKNRPPALQLWDVASDKLLWRKDIFTPDLALAPNGGLLATGIHQKIDGGIIDTVLMWDVASGKELWQLDISSNGGNALAFAPDGKTLAVAGIGTTQLLDAATGKKLLGVEGYNPLTFAPDGKSFACTCHSRLQNNGQIRLYDIVSGKVLYKSKIEDVGTWMVGVLAFTSDGKTLAAGSYYGAVRQWDVATGKELVQSTECLKIQGHEHAICATGYTSNGKKVLTVGKDLTVRQWDAATGRQLNRMRIGERKDDFFHRLVRVFGSDDYFSPFNASAFSPDLKSLVASGWRTGQGGQGRAEQCLQMWNTASGEQLWQTEVNVSALAYARDGKTLATLGWMDDSTICLLDAASGKRLWEKKLHGKNGEDLLMFGPDSQTLAVNWNGLTLLNAATGEVLRQLNGFPSQNQLSALAYAPDGRTLAVGHHESEVWLLEVASAQKILRLPLPENRASFEKKMRGEDRIRAMAFGPDGRILAWGGDAGWVRVWDLTANRETHFLNGNQGKVWSLAFGPDGRVLISGGYDGTAVIWDLSRPNSPDHSSVKKFGNEQMESLWTDLGADAGQAYRAVWTLANIPDQAVSFLCNHLQPTTPLDPARLRHLMTGLDSDVFADRERATLELKELGSLIIPELQRALENKPALETRRRIESLLMGLKQPLPRLTVEELRAHRAVQVLEQIGTTSARQLLKTLATGSPEAILTREARTALQRLTCQDMVP